MTGCAAAPPPAPPAALPDPAVLTARWETSWRAFAGIRAAVEVSLSRRGRTHGTAGALLLAPTRLRFEALTPLGLPALVVTADPDQLLVLSVAERRAWRGRPSSEGIRRWLGLGVDPALLPRLLTGHPPAPSGPATLEADRDGTLRLAFERDGIPYRVWVAGEGHPVRAELGQGAETLRVRFERAVDGSLLGVQLERPGHDVSVGIHYLLVEPLAQTPDAAFQVPVPAGIRVEPLD